MMVMMMMMSMLMMFIVTATVTATMMMGVTLAVRMAASEMMLIFALLSFILLTRVVTLECWLELHDKLGLSG